MNFFDWLRQTRNNAQHFGDRDTHCDVPWSHLKTLFDVLDDYTFGQVVSKTEHDCRVTELLEANSALVERNRRLIHILKHGGAEFSGLEIKTPWEYPPYGQVDNAEDKPSDEGTEQATSDTIQENRSDAEPRVHESSAGDEVSSDSTTGDGARLEEARNFDISSYVESTPIHKGDSNGVGPSPHNESDNPNGLPSEPATTEHEHTRSEADGSGEDNRGGSSD